MAQPVHLSDRQVSVIDSFLISLPKPSELDLPPQLGEEPQRSYVGEVQSLIPGPGGMVTENADASNVQLLQRDYLDTQAARNILHLEILGNAITVQHYRWIVKRLRGYLRLRAGEVLPHKIPQGGEFARVLVRLAERLTALGSESALSLRPLGYVECLDTLLENIESGFVMMKQSGVEQDVFIMKDKELVGYSERLLSLASRLIGDNESPIKGTECIL